MPYDHPTSSGAVNWCWSFPRTGVGALPRWVTRPILWCVWSTALSPVTGQFLLVTRTPEPPGVDSPRRTPVTPCGCLGSPCPDSLDRPSQAPTLGSPRRFGGVSWNASGPTCSRALSTRCSIDLAGPLVRVRRFRCVSHQLPHGLIPILPTVAAYLPRYHGHQSTRSGPQSVAASNPFYQSPLRDSRPAP